MAANRLPRHGLTAGTQAFQLRRRGSPPMRNTSPSGIDTANQTTWSPLELPTVFRKKVTGYQRRGLGRQSQSTRQFPKLRHQSPGQDCSRSPASTTFRSSFQRKPDWCFSASLSIFSQDDVIDIVCADGIVRTFKYRFYVDNGMFRLNIPNLTPLVAWAREHKQGIAYIEYNAPQRALYFEILRPGQSMIDIVHRSLALGTWGANTYKTIRLVLMTSDREPSPGRGTGMNKDAPHDDITKLITQSGDVVSPKRDTLRNFLAQTYPECLSEGRIDFETLRRVLGDWVEAGNERFGLVWPGKAQCMRIIQQPSAATLKPDRSQSVRFRVHQQCLYRRR